MRSKRGVSASGPDISLCLLTDLQPFGLDFSFQPGIITMHASGAFITQREGLVSTTALASSVVQLRSHTGRCIGVTPNQIYFISVLVVLLFLLK